MIMVQNRSQYVDASGEKKWMGSTQFKRSTPTCFPVLVGHSVHTFSHIDGLLQSLVVMVVMTYAFMDWIDTGRALSQGHFRSDLDDSQGYGSAVQHARGHARHSAIEQATRKFNLERFTLLLWSFWASCSVSFHSFAYEIRPTTESTCPISTLPMIQTKHEQS